VQLGNGAVEARVFMPAGNFLGINTGNGDIDVAIPRNTSALIRATAWHGVVSVSNLDVEFEFQTDNGVAGTLNGGLGFIQLTSGNGKVALAGY
jgi:DUF4097 and DUF4098 domain-containing protein YvlB